LDYITKPFELDELKSVISKAIKTRTLNENELLLPPEEIERTGIIGTSKRSLEIFDAIKRVAPTTTTVLITGETGTGKELVADAIHYNSPRKNNPLIKINCAAISETLMESELFGHEKGAFTDAGRKKPGLFVRAQRGTVFLDEIGDLPLALQGKLLRVLQERTITPVGGEEEVDIDVRVIVATNKNLKEEVKKETFREDLFYRVHVIPVLIPPLKERKEDIPPLVEHFLSKYGEQMGKKNSTITSAALQKLMLYDWPGNVRELENTIQFALAMCENGIIDAELILPDSTGRSPLPTLNEARAGFEKTYLRNLLKATAGNISRAAELAGKYRSDLYNLLKKHGLSPDEFKQ
jgi:two-component system response regulator GlrR